MKYYMLVKDVMRGSTFLLDLQDECEFKKLLHCYSNDTDYEVLECRSVKVSDGSENVFHFNSRNFMPRVNRVIGMTRNELKAYYKAIVDTILGKIYLEGVDQNKVTKAFLSFSPWEKIESIH